MPPLAGRNPALFPLIAAAASLVSCEGGAAPGEDATVLVAAIGSDPGHLNPAITTQGGTHTAAELLYDGLVRLDDRLRPQPGLARSWTVADSGRTYRFDLRTDVAWHDGTPFGSADVVYTFRHVLLRFHSRTRASLGTALDSIEAPDDSTVIFRFAAPYAPLLQQLNVTEAPILPRHLFEGSDPQRNPANLAPVGTGPFRFASYRTDDEIVYEANEAYFAGAPEIDRVVLRVIPDGGTQVVALEAGEVDWLFGLPGPDRARLAGLPGFRFVETRLNPGGSNCITTLSFNLDRPRLRDPRARRAIAHGLNRAQFLERIAFGEGAVAAAPISSGIPFAHAPEVDMPGHDPARARDLLRAAWPSSERSIDFVHFPSFTQYGALIKAQLAEIGLEVRLRPLEPAVFVNEVFVDRDFDTAIVSYCNGTDPEIGVRRMYASSNIVPIPFSNASGYRNAEVDRLFDVARSTLDEASRRRAYVAIQEILVRELPYFWLLESASTRVHRARCDGFSPAGHFAATARCGV